MSLAIEQKAAKFVRFLLEVVRSIKSGSTTKIAEISSWCGNCLCKVLIPRNRPTTKLKNSKCYPPVNPKGASMHFTIPIAPLEIQEKRETIMQSCFIPLLSGIQRSLRHLLNALTK